MFILKKTVQVIPLSILELSYLQTLNWFAESLWIPDIYQGFSTDIWWTEQLSIHSFLVCSLLVILFSFPAKLMDSEPHRGGLTSPRINNFISLMKHRVHWAGILFHSPLIYSSIYIWYFNSLIVYNYEINTYLL